MEDLPLENYISARGCYAGFPLSRIEKFDADANVAKIAAESCGCSKAR